MENLFYSILNDCFTAVLNMSFTAVFVISVIVLIRIILKKAPKIISYILWTVARFRLILPFSLESFFSLIPFNTEPIPNNIAAQPVPHIESGISVVDETISELLPNSLSVKVNDIPLQMWLDIGILIWLMGVLVMLIYGIISFIKLKRQLISAVNLESNIYTTNNINTPFILGFLRPGIYIPLNLTDDEKQCVIFHEQVHIKRHDHVVKVFAYLILCLHWFNPFVWAAFVLMSVDMEMSCDERVLKKYGVCVKKIYSESLISLASEKRFINGSPLAFGESGVKERIKNILKFKETSGMRFIIVITAVVILGTGLLLNKSKPDLAEIKWNNGLLEWDNRTYINVGIADETYLKRSSQIGIIKYDRNNQSIAFSASGFPPEVYILEYYDKPGAYGGIFKVVERRELIYADIEKIQTGMTFDEVYTLLGIPYGYLSVYTGIIYKLNEESLAVIFFNYDGSFHVGAVSVYDGGTISDSAEKSAESAAKRITEGITANEVYSILGEPAFHAPNYDEIFLLDNGNCFLVVFNEDKFVIHTEELLYVKYFGRNERE